MVDDMIANQRDFVAWWGNQVTGNRHNINPSQKALVGAF
jgi:hypothetical protein